MPAPSGWTLLVIVLLLFAVLIVGLRYSGQVRAFVLPGAVSSPPRDPAPTTGR